MCNYIVSKLSLVIGLTRLDIVDPDRLAHVILLDMIDSCHGRVSGINKICFLCSSYCRSQATAA